MDPCQTFVSSCVISLRPKNCVKKSKTATSVALVSLADNTRNSQRGGVKTQQQIPDVESIPASAPEVIKSDLVKVVDKTRYSDEQPIAIVRERSTAQQTNAKIYGDVCAQWRCEESSATATLSTSQCEIMKSQVEETTEMTKHFPNVTSHGQHFTSEMHSGMKDNVNEKTSLQQHGDAGQVACFDSMEVYQTVSTIMSQRQQLSELSVVKDQPLPASSIETSGKLYSQQTLKEFSPVEFRHEEQSLSTGGNQTCKLTGSGESQSTAAENQLFNAKQKRNEWESAPGGIALNETLSVGTCKLSTHDSDVRSIKDSFVYCQTPLPSGFHPSQIVLHDIHLISSSEAEESLSRTENLQLHESHEVNYGVVRPPIRNYDQPSCIEQISGGQHFVPTSNFHSRSRPHSRSSRIKSPKAEDEDLELLLNYTPEVKQELPTMVTVKVKGVPDELIRSGHPMITEYVTDSRRGKRNLVGSGSRTRKRNTSMSSIEKRRQGCRNVRISASNQKRDLDSMKPFGVSPNDFVQPILPASTDVLSSYPDSVFSESGFDCSEQPLPLPPLFRNDDADINENTEELRPNFTEMIPPDFVVGSSVCHPSRFNNIVSGKEVGLAFSHIDQEHAARDRFANQHMTSTESLRSFLRVRDDEFNRRTSTATVESYPDSDN